MDSWLNVVPLYTVIQVRTAVRPCGGVSIATLNLPMHEFDRPSQYKAARNRSLRNIM